MSTAHVELFTRDLSLDLEARVRLRAKEPGHGAAFCHTEDEST